VTSVRLVSASVLVASALVLAGCSGDDDSGDSKPKPTESGDVPAATQRVYLATSLACSKLDEEDATFTPLRVEGPGYLATVDPTEDCAEQTMFNTYVYDVPMPTSGDVSVTPGNQPAAELDAAEVAASDGVTVFYAREGEGRYEVSVIRPGKDEQVGSAG
jgi:hypothetical protein